MFLQLGTYKFEGVKLPQSWSIGAETEYGQIPIINAKPVVQRVGEKLKSIEIGIFLSADFCKPQQEIDGLDASRKAGEVLSLVDGTGKNYGKYVITALQVAHITSLNNGYPIAINASISLLEYNSTQTATVNKGVALTSNKPVEALPLLSPPDVPAQIQADTTAALKVINTVSAVKQQPSAGKIAQLQSQIAAGKTALISANAKVNETKKLVYRAQKLGTAYQQCTQAFDEVSTALQSGSLSELMTANNRLANAGYYLKMAHAPVVAFIGSREGGE